MSQKWKKIIAARFRLKWAIWRAYFRISFVISVVINQNRSFSWTINDTLRQYVKFECFSSCLFICPQRFTSGSIYTSLYSIHSLKFFIIYVLNFTFLSKARRYMRQLWRRSFDQWVSTISCDVKVNYKRMLSRDLLVNKQFLYVSQTHTYTHNPTPWMRMAGLRCALVRMSLVRLASQKS